MEIIVTCEYVFIRGLLSLAFRYGIRHINPAPYVYLPYMLFSLYTEETYLYQLICTPKIYIRNQAVKTKGKPHMW